MGSSGVDLGRMEGEETGVEETGVAEVEVEEVVVEVDDHWS